MSDGRLIIERYEMKYRIPVGLEAEIRRHVQAYCAPDPANRGGRYVISSLYLDSRQRRLYRETRDRQPRRFKLRVRRYVGSGAFLEIKRRIKAVVHKSRVRVPIAAWPAAMHDPAVAAGLGLSPAGQRDLLDFSARCLRIDAQPAVVVRYEREAWVGVAEDYARVTFDHRLVAGEPRGWAVPVEAHEAAWYPVDAPARFGLSQSGVILELKCTTEVPQWMTDLVHRFDLRRSGFSKYGTCLEHVEAWRHPGARLRRSAL